MRRALKDRGVYWWVGPTNKQCKITWDMFHRTIPRRLFTSRQHPAAEISLLNGSILRWMSAESQTLSGEGLTGVVVDEAPQVPEIIWNRDLLPSLLDKHGWALVIGTPRGRNWFWRLHCRGAAKEPGYEALHFPSYENPHLPRAEVEALQGQMTSDMYRQEILAEFLEDAAQVFRHVRERATATPGEAAFAVVGVDLAKVQDFTVCVALDGLTGTMLAMERFNQLDWSLQREKIVAFCAKVNAKSVWVDSTGLGDVVTDDLRRMIPGGYMRVNAFKFTTESKVKLVENLIIGFDKSELAIFNDDTLVNELLAYEYQITQSGRISYNAPEGMHDDCVMSLALAFWGVKHKVLLAG